MYAFVVVHDAVNNVETPKAFLYLDCSCFILRTGELSCVQQLMPGVEGEFRITSRKLLLGGAIPFDMEPMLISMDAVSCVPVMEDESIAQTAATTWVYGLLRFGQCMERMVLSMSGRPVASEKIISDDHSESAAGAATAAASRTSAMDSNALSKVDIVYDLKTVLLTSLRNAKALKESLSCSAFCLELHHQRNLFERCFTEKRVQEYNQIRINGSSSLSSSSSSKKSSSNTSSRDKLTTSQHHHHGGGSLSSSDQYLINSCVGATLAESAQILPHGEGRFRLEQLLSTSGDLLKEFARKRRRRQLQLEQERMMAHKQKKAGKGSAAEKKSDEETQAHGVGDSATAGAAEDEHNLHHHDNADDMHLQDDEDDPHVIISVIEDLIMMSTMMMMIMNLAA